MSQADHSGPFIAVSDQQEQSELWDSLKSIVLAPH